MVEQSCFVKFKTGSHVGYSAALRIKFSFRPIDPGGEPMINRLCRDKANFGIVVFSHFILTTISVEVTGRVAQKQSVGIIFVCSEFIERFVVIKIPIPFVAFREE